MKNIKALCIDIDATIIDCLKKEGMDNPMFTVLFEAAKQEGKFSDEEIRKIIDDVRHNVHWWHWGDFIVALELNPRRFWDFAYEFEKEYMVCCGNDIAPALHKLKERGYYLFITSNNPTCGILHKLRLAGLASNQEAPLFSQILGCQEMKAQKHELYYWRNALTHIALDGGQVATIGDDLLSDGLMPLKAGIARAFIVNRDTGKTLTNDNEKITIVSSFHEITKVLTGEN